VLFRKSRLILKEYGLGCLLCTKLYEHAKRHDGMYSSMARISKYEMKDDGRTCTVYIDLRYIRINKTLEINVPCAEAGFSRGLITHGIREPIHSKLLYDIIKKNNVESVLDIGSHVGYFPLLEVLAGAKKVVAVEPVPQSYQYLVRNLKRYCPSCIALDVAVTEKASDYVTMYIPKDDNGIKLSWSSVQKHKNIINKNLKLDKIKVKNAKIDDLIQKFKPSMVRMDIEGAEWHVLRSSERLSEAQMIDIEMHPFTSADVIENTLKKLRDIGFKKITLLRAVDEVPSLLLIVSRLLGIKFLVNCLSNTYSYCKGFAKNDQWRRIVVYDKADLDKLDLRKLSENLFSRHRLHAIFFQ